MFSLLTADNPGSGSELQIAWQPATNVAPTPPLAVRSVPLSVADQLSAPSVFLQQALVLQLLDDARLQDAVQAAVNKFPAFGARAVAGQDGGPALEVGPSAGIAFLRGSSPLSLQQLAAVRTPPPPGDQQSGAARMARLQLPELADALFGHLPGALPAYIGRPELALTHVALVTLPGGGCVLGLRSSHLLADFASLRLLMAALADAYNASAAAASDSDALQGSQQLVAAAPLLNRLILAARRQLPARFEPVRFKPLTPADEAVFAQLGQLSSSDISDSASASGGPRRLTYHATPDVIAALKQQAADSLAAGSNGGNSSSSRWCSSHNVLLARVLQVFAGLPGRAGLPHDVSVAVDMRGRVPAPLLQAAQQAQQQGGAGGAPLAQQLARSIGNFFASAIAEGCQPASHSLGQLAQQLHAAVQRGSELWLPDLAWVSQAKGIPAAELDPASAVAEQQAPADEPGTQQVTWARLHAMGPRGLLERQMALGLLASLSTTQWPLDCQGEACLGGAEPLLAVPSFSQPQPFPLLLTQQAPPAIGGGLLLHVWLDEQEARQFEAAAAAQGGL